MPDFTAHSMVELIHMSGSVPVQMAKKLAQGIRGRRLFPGLWWTVCDEVMVVGKHCPCFQSPSMVRSKVMQFLVQEVSALWCGKMVTLIEASGGYKIDAGTR